MKPLTRYAIESDRMGLARLAESSCGRWYAKDEADARIAELEAEVERLKAVPMKYRRMEFNAKLQAERDQLEAELAQLRITSEVASRHLMRERDDAWAERDAARAANAVKVGDMMEALYRTYLSLTAGDSYDAERYMRQEFWRRMAVAAIDAARGVSK
jgi:regulator of replication initiation timing